MKISTLPTLTLPLSPHYSKATRIYCTSTLPSLWNSYPSHSFHVERPLGLPFHSFHNKISTLSSTNFPNSKAAHYCFSEWSLPMKIMNLIFPADSPTSSTSRLHLGFLYSMLHLQTLLFPSFWKTYPTRNSSTLWSICDAVKSNFIWKPSSLKGK